MSRKNTVFIPVNYTTNGPSTHLADDWLTPEERILKQRELIRREEIRSRGVSLLVQHPVLPIHRIQHLSTTPCLLQILVSLWSPLQFQIPLPAVRLPIVFQL